MSLITPLPKIMVAPNGARRMKNDHANLPITIEETVATAQACEKAGADGIHVHVRDGQCEHTLDIGLYKEVLDELAIAAPGLYVQITTEAVGRYSPHEQRNVVLEVKPKNVSISIAEMMADADHDRCSQFYQQCYDEAISVQHIIYGQEDLVLLEAMIQKSNLVGKQIQLLFVLGRYTVNQQSDPNDLAPFTSWLENSEVHADWAICAFGRGETDCLLAAHQVGGKMRVGFENSLQNRDGSIAIDNAERVAEIVRLTT